MILDHPTLSESEVKLLISASDKVYPDEVNENQVFLNGWDVITPELINHGLDSGFIPKNTNIFRVEGSEVFGINAGNADAAVFESGNTIILAFRGTEVGQLDFAYWTRMPEFYNLFEPLFQALDNYTNANAVSKIFVTGHSLGAAMTELFMAENHEQIYSAVSVASPLATNDSTDTRILNLGYENDRVYEVLYETGGIFGSGNGANPNNSTANLNIAIGKEHQIGSFPYNHQMRNYLYGTNRVFDSAYYSQIKKDSLVIVDRTDNEIQAITNIIANAPVDDAFILGENDDQDNINGGKGNDVIEGLGGNDTLRGDNFDIDWYRNKIP